MYSATEPGKCPEQMVIRRFELRRRFGADGCEQRLSVGGQRRSGTSRMIRVSQQLPRIQTSSIAPIGYLPVHICHFLPASIHDKYMSHVCADTTHRICLLCIACDTSWTARTAWRPRVDLQILSMLASSSCGHQRGPPGDRRFIPLLRCDEG